MFGVRVISDSSINKTINELLTHVWSRAFEEPHLNPAPHTPFVTDFIVRTLHLILATRLAYTFFDYCHAPDIHENGIEENIVFLKLLILISTK